MDRTGFSEDVYQKFRQTLEILRKHGDEKFFQQDRVTKPIPSTFLEMLF